MAEDWIKVRANLPLDPAVLSIAEACKIDEDAVVGKLVRIWIWADQQLRDGNAVSVTFLWLDRYVGVSGFAEAMQKVRWLTPLEKGFGFPKFDKHMGKSAKKRALAAERAQRFRNAADVTPALPELELELESKRELKFSSSDSQVAQKIWLGVLDVCPNRKPPMMGKWADTVRLMVERDGHSHQEILDLFAWVNKDSFWRVNILSPGKLREKWDQLQARRNQKPEISKKPKIDLDAIDAKYELERNGSCQTK